MRIGLLRGAEAETGDPRLDAIKSARKLHAKNLLKWLKALEVVHPGLRSEAAAVDMDHPEKFILPLPSRLSDAKHKEHNLEHAHATELSYRKIQATALLVEARIVAFEQQEAVRVKGSATGQRANTRMGKIVNAFHLEKALTSGKYNHVRRMLLNLVGEDAKSISEYQELNIADMSCKFVKAAGKRKSPKEQAKEKRAAGGKGSNWLWRLQKPGELADEDDELWQLDSTFPLCIPDSIG